MVSLDDYVDRYKVVLKTVEGLTRAYFVCKNCNAEIVDEEMLKNHACNKNYDGFIFNGSIELPNKPGYRHSGRRINLYTCSNCKSTIAEESIPTHECLDDKI